MEIYSTYSTDFTDNLTDSQVLLGMIMHAQKVNIRPQICIVGSAPFVTLIFLYMMGRAVYQRELPSLA